METTIERTISPEVVEELIKIRKHLHAHPELSEEESETAKTVAEYLAQCRPSQIIRNLGGHGVAAIFDSGKPGKTLMFRADLDALPIEETNDFDYRSTKDHVSHKCGHDGHTTVLLGLAKTLAERPIKKGKLILLFQPAEENGVGAAAVMKDEKFKDLKPDCVFAFHNLPGYPLSEIVVKNGSFTAAVTSIIIKLHGKTSHAAEPEKGVNPALAIAEILQETHQLSNNEPERDDFTVVTPIHMEMGKIYYGISAGYGELRLTLRTWTQEVLDQLCDEVVKIVRQKEKRYGLTIETGWTQEFQANQNDEEAVALVRQAADENGLSLTERAFPFKWGEDFGIFTQHFRGAMFGIGAGKDSPALHNPDYDFPDDIIPTGIKMFASIISKFDM